MVYNRGNRRNFDEWDYRYGCTGWNYRNLMKYFLRMENQADPDYYTPYHNRTGPITVTSNWIQLSLELPIFKDFLNTAQMAGYPIVDVNGNQQEQLWFDINRLFVFSRTKSEWRGTVRAHDQGRRQANLFQYILEASRESYQLAHRHSGSRDQNFVQRNHRYRSCLLPEWTELYSECQQRSDRLGRDHSISSIITLVWCGTKRSTEQFEHSSGGGSTCRREPSRPHQHDSVLWYARAGKIIRACWFDSAKHVRLLRQCQGTVDHVPQHCRVHIHKQQQRFRVARYYDGNGAKQQLLEKLDILGFNLSRSGSME